MRPTAIGISIFGGGFTLGMQNAGFKILGQFEECDAGRRTFDLNFKNIPRPLRVHEWPWREHAGKVDVVYANPPCAPWSAGNTRKGMTMQDRFADPRLDMTARAMKTGMLLEPKAFILESVARAYTGGAAYYERWAKEWMAKGYAVTWLLTDALLHGVASTRQRFHFIAHRGELKLIEPSMTGFVPKTARAAIADLENKFGHLTHHEKPKHSRQLVELMRRCEPGRQLRDASREWKGYDGPLHSFMVRKALWDSVAFTVIKLDEIVHPGGERMLTWREGLRLCGYPDDFRIAAPCEATQAVLPPVAAYVGRLLKWSLNARRCPVALSVVDWRALGAPYRPGAIRELLREAGEI